MAWLNAENISAATRTAIGAGLDVSIFITDGFEGKEYALILGSGALYTIVGSETLVANAIGDHTWGVYGATWHALPAGEDIHAPGLPELWSDAEVARGDAELEARKNEVIPNVPYESYDDSAIIRRAEARNEQTLYGPW